MTETIQEQQREKRLLEIKTALLERISLLCEEADKEMQEAKNGGR